MENNRLKKEKESFFSGKVKVFLILIAFEFVMAIIVLVLS